MRPRQRKRPLRRTIYKLCAEYRLGCYWKHKVVLTLKAARRLVSKMGADVCVLRIHRHFSVDVTNRILGRPGPTRKLGSRKRALER